MSTHRTASILGIPVDDVTMDEAVDRIAAMIEHGRTSGRVHQIATVNVDFVCNAIHDHGLMRILGRTDLSIADGMLLVWGSRGSARHCVNVWLVPIWCRRWWSVRLRADTGCISSAPPRRWRSRRPPCCASGFRAPRSWPSGTMFADPADMDPAALVPIKAARPDICCVALGNPKQERWIERFGADVGAPVVIGVGGTLDFVSGTKRRAPQWAQRYGLEWVHRAVTEPRRLIRRYARTSSSSRLGWHARSGRPGPCARPAPASARW